MTGSEMFAVMWLSMATTVYAWGAIMIVAMRTLDIRPVKAFLDDREAWVLLTGLTVLLLPVAVGMLVYDSVQLHREVSR